MEKNVVETGGEFDGKRWGDKHPVLWKLVHPKKSRRGRRETVM